MNVMIFIPYVIQIRMTFTFLALHRSQAEFFSGFDDPCSLPTNSATLLGELQCKVPNMTKRIFRVQSRPYGGEKGRESFWVSSS